MVTFIHSCTPFFASLFKFHSKGENTTYHNKFNGYRHFEVWAEFLVVVDSVFDEDENQHGGKGRRHCDVVHLVQVHKEISV